MKRNKLLESVGITRKHLRDSVRYNIIITVIGFFVVTALGLSVGFKRIELDLIWLPFYVIISVPLQELIFRGIIQTSLYRFDKKIAVTASAILYAAVHYYDPTLVVLTLAAGLAWGYAFWKKPNLLGPVISHAVLGVYLFLFVL